MNLLIWKLVRARLGKQTAQNIVPHNKASAPRHTIEKEGKTINQRKGEVLERSAVIR